MVGFGYQRHDGTAGRPSGVGGRLAASLFFLFFFGMGSVFAVLLMAEIGRAVSQRAWKSVPCKIVASEVQERRSDDNPYAFTVSYTYEYGGQAYSGSVYQRRYKSSAKYSEAQALSQKYPPGSTMSCYMNPKSPADAVLKRDSLALGFFIVIPLIFVYIGAGGLYFTWHPKPEKTKSEAAESLAGKSVRSGVKGKFGLAFFGIFGVAGLAMLYPLGIRPIAKTVDARSWVATPCKVLRAEVRSHSDSDDGGTTYSVYILYEYTVGEKSYKSDCYDFVGGSSSGQQGKARIVEQYRKATSPICYVNPENPSEAVLRQGLHAKLLIVLLPLTFILVGFGGACGVLRGKNRTAVGGASVLRLTEGDSVVLKPRHSPFGKLAVVILITLFWNGAVSIALAEIVGSFRNDHPNWFLSVFMVPFEIVGLVLVVSVVHEFLALFNPRPTLRLSSAVVPLGGAAELSWSFSGRVGRIKEFTVTLRGIEEVTYQRKTRKGTENATDKSTFYEMELCRTSNTDEIAAGSVGFVIPGETMYSFEAPNNKIIWGLDVQGKIARWPDVKESFKIAVVPAKG